MHVTVHPLTDDGRVALTAYVQEPSQELGNMSQRPAVLVFPGGGYLFTSDREAEPVALAYAAEGFQTFVLRYSVGSRARGFQPLREAEQALAFIRANADAWHVLPDQIAVCGFSAGGHLAGAVGLFGSERPNALILGYPAVDLGRADDHATAKSPLVRSLLGHEFTQEELDAYSLHKRVPDNAPPLFMWHTCADRLVTIDHTLKLARAYADKGCPFEYHVFQEGEHGLSLAKAITSSGRRSMVESRCQAWFSTSVEWLQTVFSQEELTDADPVLPDEVMEFLGEPD